MRRLATLHPGREVDRYRVIDVLGEGGMAVVYRVAHDQLGSLHALKVVAVPSRSIMRRLIDEGRAQAKIRHRNIVAVHDVVEVDGSPGLVMEYVAGPTLEDLIYGVALPIEQIDALGRGLLRGIAAAHAQGFVHRDLKPANVLVAFGADGLTPKIADFGLVKDLGSPSGRTYTGAFMGTPNYVAPEQVRDARGVDHRADLWAAGAVLYELLTQRRAFVGDDVLDVFNAVAAARYAPLSEVLPDAPARMRRAIESALVVDADRRIGSAEEMLDLWAGDVDEASLTPMVRELNPTLRAQVEQLASSPPAPEQLAMRPPGITLAMSDHPATVLDSAARRRKWPAVAITGLSLLVVMMVAVPAIQLGVRSDAPTAVPRPPPTKAPAVPAPVPVTPSQPAPAAPVPRPRPIITQPAPHAAPNPEPIPEVRLRGLPLPGEEGEQGTPDPEPDPEPVEDPLRTQGRVEVAGDPVRMMLAEVRGSALRSPGFVPPGLYDVQVTFPSDSAPTQVARIEVAVGETVTLRCVAQLKKCQVVR